MDIEWYKQDHRPIQISAVEPHACKQQLLIYSMDDRIAAAALTATIITEYNKIRMITSEQWRYPWRDLQLLQSPDLPREQQV